MLGWTVLSQLKQDPATRHIPVQIVTLDEDRQHGLARGAFSFVTKPATTEGLRGRARQRSRSTPRRGASACWSSRTTPPSSSASPSCWATTTSTSWWPTRGPRRSPALGERAYRLRRARPAAAGHVRVRGAGAHPRRRAAVRRLPVVVFTGRELSPEEDARLHTLARSVVVKGVESPERLLDETALFLHRVVTDLPPDKQRLLERLHRSDEDLVGQDGPGRRRRRAQHLRAEQRARTPRDAGRDRHHRPGGHRPARDDPERGDRAHGHHDARDGRLRDDARDPREAGLPAPADHRPHGEGDEGRPREVPRGRRVRLPRQAGQHRAAALRRCGCGCTGEPRAPRERARQGQHPAGRRPAGQAAELRGDPGRAGREPHPGRLGERGADAPPEERVRRACSSTCACRSWTASSWRP